MGFLIGEHIMKKKGLRARVEKRRLNLEELPKYLKEKYFADSYINIAGKKIVSGVDEKEFEEAMERLRLINSNEILIVSGNEFRYLIEKGKTSIYVKVKLISMRDFAEIWSLVRGVLA